MPRTHEKNESPLGLKNASPPRSFLFSGWLISLTVSVQLLIVNLPIFLTCPLKTILSFRKIRSLFTFSSIPFFVYLSSTSIKKTASVVETRMFVKNSDKNNFRSALSERTRNKMESRAIAKRTII